MVPPPSVPTLLSHALTGRPAHDGPRLALRGGEVTTPLRDGLVLGRARSAGLRLPVPEISRVHAEVVAVPDGWAVVDRSKNGLAVNAAPVRGAAPLRAGDELSLGPVRLRVIAAETGRSPEGTRGAPAEATAPTGSAWPAPRLVALALVVTAGALAVLAAA